MIFRRGDLDDNSKNNNTEVKGSCYNDNNEVTFDKRIKNLDKYPLALNVDEVAKVLGVSKQNAYTLCHNGKFPCVKIGKRLVIPKKAFERWMQNPFIFEKGENSNG